MRATLLLLLAILITGCSPSTPVATNSDQPSESGTSTSSTSNDKVESSAVGESAATLAERMNSEAADGLAALKKEYESASKKWRESRSDFNSQEEYEAWYNSNPASVYGDKFSKLAAKFPETPSAVRAIDFLIKNLPGPAKTSAIKNRLAAAELNPTSEDSGKIFEQIMTFGDGDSKVKAMEHVLSKAKKNLDSEEGLGLLTKLIKTRTESEPKNKAVECLMTVIDKDIESETSAKHLSLISLNGGKEAKAQALDKMMTHHIDNDEMLKVIDSFARQMPSTDVENSFKRICDSANGHIKHHAAIGFAKFLSMRDLYRDSFAGMSEEDLKMVDKDMVEYLNKEPDPSDQIKLEKMLESYVENNESLIEEAKKRLFVMQNISIGKVAPEIVGSDLDGQEFKLSDYRGKVVLIDFWGDW